MLEYEYDVAISFAGEDREFARKLAKQLKKQSLSVFFDEFEQSAVLGKNWLEIIRDVYYEQSQFCIVIISQHYVKKWFPKGEIRAASERAFFSDMEYILGRVPTIKKEQPVII